MTLSPRERQVVMLVGVGWSYGEVGKQLGISKHTVRTSVARIMGRYPSPQTPREALVTLYHTVVLVADSVEGD